MQGLGGSFLYIFRVVNEAQEGWGEAVTDLSWGSFYSIWGELLAPIDYSG